MRLSGWIEDGDTALYGEGELGAPIGVEEARRVFLRSMVYGL